MRKYWPVVLLISAAIAAPSTGSAQEVTQAGASRAISIEAAIGTGIAERQLTGTADSFSVATGVLYCYMRIANAAGAQVEHVWYKGNTEENRVKLNIGGSPWRTWSTRKLGPDSAGSWRCDVVQSGKVLQSVKFTVE